MGKKKIKKVQSAESAILSVSISDSGLGALVLIDYKAVATMYISSKGKSYRQLLLESIALISETLLTLPEAKGKTALLISEVPSFWAADTPEPSTATVLASGLYLTLSDMDTLNSVKLARVSDGEGLSTVTLEALTEACKDNPELLPEAIAKQQALANAYSYCSSELGVDLNKEVTV